MPFRNAVARIVLADARRFEVETAAMLREILNSCADAETRRVLEDILAEEEGHAARLSEAREGVEAGAPPPPAVRETLPAPPSAAAPPGAICDRLREVLTREEASALFYSLLARRTVIPFIRNLFNEIAEQERGHAKRLAEHIAALCAGR